MTGTARRAVRHLLAVSTGTESPEWRACFDEDGQPEPTAIAPVCLDEGHDPDDGSVYECCPGPVIETGSPDMAEYLVELLNADRGAPNRAAGKDTPDGGEFTLPPATTPADGGEGR